MSVGPQILMCVSPGEDFEAALDYVVEEAARRGCGVHLALAVRPIWVGPPDVADLRLVDGEWRKYGTDFLVDCERRVSKAVGPDTPVSTEITHGSVVPTLVEVSQNAGDRRHAAPPHGPRRVTCRRCRSRTAWPRVRTRRSWRCPTPGARAQPAQ